MYRTTFQANLMREPLARFGLCALLVGLACGLLLFLSITEQASAQTTVGVRFIQYPISSLAGDVQMIVSVSPPDGIPLSNLSKGMFTIREDEDTLPITPTVAPDPDPSAVLILIDASRNMFPTSPGAQKPPPPIERAKEIAVKLVNNGPQGKHEMAISIFNATDTFSKTQDYTTDQMSIISHIGMIKDAPADEGTCLYDAIVRAEEDVNTTLRHAKAVIVITNNRDIKPGQSHCSRRSRQDVVNKANEKDNNTSLYFLGISQAVDVNNLQDIANDTNGKFALVDNEGQLDATFKELFQRLGGRYVLKYKSNAETGPHQLRVEVKVEVKPDSNARPIIGETTVYIHQLPKIEGPDWTKIVLFAIGIVAIVTMLLTLYMFLNRGRAGAMGVARKPASVTKGEPLAQLTVVQAPGLAKQQEHFLYGDRSVGLGRDENQAIQLPGERMSRAHGEIIYRRNQFFYNDVNATNGTEVDAQPVPKGSPVPLRDGSEILFGGQTRAVFRLRPAGMAAATSNHQPANAPANAGKGLSRVPQAELRTTEWVRETPLQEKRDA